MSISSSNSKKYQDAQQLFNRTLTELSRLSVDKQRYEEGKCQQFSPSLYLSICSQMKLTHQKLKRISSQGFYSTTYNRDNPIKTKNKLTNHQADIPHKNISI